MNGQCYLFLIRHPIPDNPTLLKAKLPFILKDIIRGDSLDVPFVNFIRCYEFNHEIGSGGLSYGDRTGSRVKWVNAPAEPPPGQELSRMQRAQKWFSTKPGIHLTHTRSLQGTNSWTGDDEPGLFNDRMPEHGSVCFTKNLDAASPQLSFGCSAQERFPLAVFFFRRKTTFNIGGVVHPHTVIGYQNCLISDWSTDGNTETVQLNYEVMGMAAFTQIADSKLPQGVSWRTWDTVNNVGGEKKPFGALLIPLTLGVIAIGSLVANAIGAPESYFSNED